MKNNLIKFFICAVILGVAATANAKKPKIDYYSNINVVYNEQQISSQPDFEIIDNDTVWRVVDKMPRFPGSEKELYKFLNNNIRYPLSMMERGIQGRVTCQFIVEKDGSITNIEVIKKLYPDGDKEAVRLIQLMPKWEAGEKDGKKVRVFFTLPITYRLINN
ncbi:MAG: energy transducer TonB [Prevotellaceae bacterium]|jgi:protein TonB|nr:energy transducer TonB [Prevotellaceae bacterium]